MLESWQLVHGGQGISSVTLCHYQGCDEDVCVKAYVKAAMAPRHVLNLRRELEILGALGRQGVPGVVELLDVSETPDSVLLFFRACPGGTLLHALRTQPWSEARLRDGLAAPLTATLARLHSLGVVHRDIKPENVFIDEDGAPVLGDFGLAIDSASERPISRVGTAGFIAPEVLAQPSAEEAAALPPSWVPSYDEKADVWSLGALMVEALTGELPPAPNGPYLQPPQLPPGASSACVDFVLSALNPNPARRPSARQLLQHPWLASCAEARLPPWRPNQPPPAWQRQLQSVLRAQAADAAWRGAWARQQAGQGAFCGEAAWPCGPSWAAPVSPPPVFMGGYPMPSSKHGAAFAAPPACASTNATAATAAAAAAAAAVKPANANAASAAVEGAPTGASEVLLRRRCVFDSVDSFSEPLTTADKAAAAQPAVSRAALAPSAAELMPEAAAPAKTATPKAPAAQTPVPKGNGKSKAPRLVGSLLASLLCARTLQVAC